MKKKSIGFNAILNTIQSVMSMLFPLITFPYISRTLGVLEVGKYNFALSIVNYFVLLAGLGINTYAIREGSRLKENKSELLSFSRDIFSINIFSTIISYALLMISLVVSEKLHDYSALIMILSVQIIFVTVGRSWLYSIYEDYFYITLRTIVFQFLSLVMMFILVKDSDDILLYAMVSVVGTVFSNVVNLLISKKYAKLSFTWKPNWKHLKPILMIFSTALSITVYGSSGTTILGIFCGDYNVGLYSVSVKIYNIVKQVVAAVLTVTIPRFSYYVGIGNEASFKDLFVRVFNVLVVILLPIVTGLAMISNEIILIISGNEFVEASYSLSILSVAMIFNLFTYMFGYCVLLPYHEEKLFLRATIVSAIVNIILNFILVPFFAHNAAAFTTVVAEAVAAFICFRGIKKYVDFEGVLQNLFSVVLGCIWIVIACLFIKGLSEHYVVTVVLAVLSSACGYFLILWLKRNVIILEFINSIYQKIHNKFRGKS